MPTKNPGDVLTSALWNTYVRDNIDKLLSRGHRVLTVAQFAALSGLEDGDEVYLEVDAANAVQWHLRYLAATTSWRFLGGPPLFTFISTSEAPGSTGAWVNLATSGPTITLPRGGTYDYEFSVTMNIGTGASDRQLQASVWKNDTAAVASQVIYSGDSNANMLNTAMGRYRGGGFAASDTVRIKYQSNFTTVAFADRGLSVWPVVIL